MREPRSGPDPIVVHAETIAIPHRDACETFARLRRRFGDGGVFLLESLTPLSADARTSILGFNPLLTLRLHGQDVELEGRSSLVGRIATRARRDGVVTTIDDRLRVPPRGLWNLLRTIESEFLVTGALGGEAFTFGFFGYLGYDAAWSIETLPVTITTDAGVPDVVLSLYQGIVEFDLATSKGRLTINNAPTVWPALSLADVARVMAADDLRAPLLDAELTVPPPLAVSDTIDRGHYLDLVRRALHYIGIGDIYQVQLGHRIDIESVADPFRVYRRLRTRNPSPYMYFAPFGAMVVFGASPELYVRVADERITMRPLAGTVRRGRTPEEDATILAAFKHDEKEVAEHIMLVDLCRNDIGRVCRGGTLTTPELMGIAQFSHVNHLVSTVVGDQRPDTDVYDLVRATFPAGTMTGAPKIRAMEIIEELETTRRGPYAGALGLIDFTGYANLALSIRSAVHRGHRYEIRASAGVVADSQPEREWAETLQKMAAAYWAIAGQEMIV